MLRRAVHVFGELMITVGLFLLLFLVWQMWWTTIVSEAESRDVTASLAKEWETPTEPAAPVKPAEPPVDPNPAGGKPFGIIHIPKFGSDWDPRPIIQGTSVEDLKHGVGHYPETVMPGAIGNVAIAGHRVTYGAPFNLIAELKPKDQIIVETKTGWYTYLVTSSQIVKPHQVEVVAPVPNKPGAKATERMLTLTACHPMYSARERYIVHAKYDTFTPRSAGAPATVAANA